MGCLLLDTKHAVEQAKAAERERCQRKRWPNFTPHTARSSSLATRRTPSVGRPADGRRPKRTKAQNLLLRLDQREQEVLRFAHDFRVPFDNNLSERDLRMVNLQQKISGCWRTTHGAERFLAIRSYLSTGRKQGQQPIDVLYKLAAWRPWLPHAAGP